MPFRQAQGPEHSESLILLMNSRDSFNLRF
jgi:hypothetical protein